MATINILSGSFEKGSGNIGSDSMFLPIKGKHGEVEKVSLSKIKSVKAIKMEDKRRWGRTAALGATGGVLFGPIGFVGGALLGGNKTMIKFEMQLKDGRKLTGVCESDVFKRLLKYSK